MRIHFFESKIVVSLENGLEFSGFVDELSSTVIGSNELHFLGHNPMSLGASFSYDYFGTSLAFPPSICRHALNERRGISPVGDIASAS